MRPRTPISQRQRDHQLLSLPENTAGRDFFVGDVHGQYDKLMAELAAVEFDRTADRLISVGDLIDRGPESLKCLELVLEPWFHCVIGNHEDFFIAAIHENSDQGAANLFGNGGRWVLMEDQDDLRFFVADSLLDLPCAIEVPFRGHRLGVIHAAVTSGTWSDFNMDADIWNRRISARLETPDGKPEPLPPEATVQGIDLVIVGHNVVKHPTLRGNTLNLDCGAARGRGVTLWSADQVLEFARQHRLSHNDESIYIDPREKPDAEAVPGTQKVPAPRAGRSKTPGGEPGLF